jgi:predicted glycoside hydrolase/deacetylase ChbG (UPF0249 family)
MLRTEVAEGVTELSCHPGYLDRHLDSTYAGEREMELKTLCSPSIRTVLGELGVVIIGFRDLARAASRAC